ncbi:MAG: hypothetical protein AABZ39_01175 [Spirochaetota bacterium]
MIKSFRILCLLCFSAYAQTNDVQNIGERYFQLPEFYAALARSSPTNAAVYSRFSNAICEFLAPSEWENVRRAIVPRGGAYPTKGLAHLAVKNRVLKRTMQSNDCDVLIYQAERVNEYDNFPFLIWDDTIQRDDIADFLRQFTITNQTVESLSNRFAELAGSSVSVVLASEIEFSISVRTITSNEQRITAVHERLMNAALTLSPSGRSKRPSAGMDKKGIR